MRAIIQSRYGSPEVLEFGEVPKPTPEDDEVLIKVHASSVNAADWHIMRGLPYIARAMGRGMGFGLFKPIKRVQGWDVAGTVDAVGKNVKRLQLGDEVFGESESNGAFAEYVRASEGTLALKPANLTFEQAAAVPLAANTALICLRDQGQVQPGQKVLINGASGGVGTFAVQLAKWLGADVTAVCSTKKMDMVRSIGADQIIDYTREDFTRSGQRYDLIFDGVANRSLSDCRRALNPTGTLILSGGTGGRWIGPMGLFLRAALLSPFVRQKLISGGGKISTANLVLLKELIESGKITPIIDRTYPLRETPDAIRYVEERHVQGKVVITM